VDRSEGSVGLRRPLMGTVWSVEVVHQGNGLAARQAGEAVFDELERIDRLMSEWRPESPVSQINDAAGRALVEVPAELRELLERSVAYSRNSDGAFDITWRGMRHLWRFDDGFRVPAAAEVDAARALVNYRDLRIEGNRVGLARAGMSIGLGGIAKGYAIDRAAAILEQRGFGNYLVDGGGDIRVKGTTGGRPWRLGIQNPRAERGTLLGAVSLTSGALVTSGDYERFKLAGGVRYHHIIDPHTGWPASVCRSVTVIAPTAEQAVVWAKIIFIGGPAKGLAAARAEGLAALAIDAGGARHETPGFARAFEEKGSTP
jgi:thiamine biosynthesis lipoprotein